MNRSGETFFGFPQGKIGAGLDAHIGIFGAPHGTPYEPGKPSHSVDAHEAIRAASQRDVPRRDHYDFDSGGPMLTDAGLKVVDCGDLPGDPSEADENRKRIRQAAKAILEAGAVPVMLGGDDSVPIPFVAAYEGRGPVWVVQVDAHLDWRDERDGERFGWSSPMRRMSEMEHVAGMVQVGLRGVGSARSQEVEDARGWGSKLVTAAEVHANGAEVLAALVPRGADVIVTFDCDALDPAIMPGVLTRAPGGLTYSQAVSLIHALSARARIAGFDLVELMPARDADGLSALTAYRLVANAISAIARGLASPR